MHDLHYARKSAQVDVTALVEALLDNVPSGARENAHAEDPDCE